MTSETREDGFGGTGAGDDHVGGSDRVVEAFEADGDSTDTLGEAGTADGRPIGDEDVGTTGTVQCDGDTFTHRSGADDEHPLAGRGRRRPR